MPCIITQPQLLLPTSCLRPATNVGLPSPARAISPFMMRLAMHAFRPENQQSACEPPHQLDLSGPQSMGTELHTVMHHDAINVCMHGRFRALGHARSAA